MHVITSQKIGENLKKAVRLGNLYILFLKRMINYEMTSPRKRDMGF